LGGYAVAVVLVAWFAVRYPDAYIHVTPLEGFGLAVIAKLASFVGMTVGTLVGLLLVRGDSAPLPAAWLLLSGAFVVLVAWALPTLPPIVLESCPPLEVCNPYDWSVPLDWFREPLLALAAGVIIGLAANRKSGAPPNTAFKRTREG
jgi:hypothetical protein